MTLTMDSIGRLQKTAAVERYFQTFNQGQFLETAQLFTQAGQLQPPFEDPIVGPDAIYAYLKREAAGMQANPQETTIEQLEANDQRIVVKGNVKALIFNVNAAWIFKLNPQGHIEQVEVKLLASLQELLTLRP
ncbi:nuclear transport factor 2 [filamentous cyanobacterium CCP5]|nr:nuclear transport factor 2 [filamentous cyanobacterium CCP5]